MAWIQIQYMSKTCKLPMALDAVIPEEKNSEIPVLFLLHDLGQNQSHWIRETKIEKLAEQYKTAVVMVQGMNTFYMNTKNARAMQDFLIEELLEYVSFWFGIAKRPCDRILVGTGMGGFGAAFTLLEHPECFEKAAALDMRDPKRYYQNPEEAKQFGIRPETIWGTRDDWEKLCFWEKIKKAEQDGCILREEILCDGKNSVEDMFLEDILQKIGEKPSDREKRRLFLFQTTKKNQLECGKEDIS